MTSAAMRHARNGIVARDILHTKLESGRCATSCVGALATNFLKKGLNNETLRRLPFLRLYQRKRHLRQQQKYHVWGSYNKTRLPPPNYVGTEGITTKKPSKNTRGNVKYKAYTITNKNK